MTRSRSWVPRFILLAAIWGSAFLLIKIGVRTIAPFWVAAGRIVVGAVALLVALAVTRTRLPRGRVWVHLAVMGLLWNSVPFVLFSWAETHITSVLAGLLNAATPLATVAALSMLVPEERPGRSRLIGVLIGFGGVVIVLGPWQGVGDVDGLAALAALGATICYGVGFAYQRRFLIHRSESVLALTAGQLLAATAQIVVVAWLVSGLPSGAGAPSVLAVIGLGVFATGLAYVLNARMIRDVGATVASTVTYVTPLFSTLLGIVLLNESLNWNEPLGGLVVLAGVAGAQGRLDRVLRRRPGVSPVP